MPDNRIPTASRRMPRTKRRKCRDKDDIIRICLVVWTAVLTLLVFWAYYLKGDIRVLLGGTVVAVAVWQVYSYYFKK
jgi:hypothetical protein